MYFIHYIYSIIQQPPHIVWIRQLESLTQCAYTKIAYDKSLMDYYYIIIYTKMNNNEINILLQIKFHREKERVYSLDNSRARDKASSHLIAFCIHSFGIASKPYFAPRHAPTRLIREQLHPPAKIT